MMRFSAYAIVTIGLLSLSPSLSTTDAFVPRQFSNGSVKSSGTKIPLHSSTTAVVQEISTKPIPGMKPGTSGLRKKVEVWQGADPDNKYYVDNFIQSLLDTAANKNSGEMPKT